MRMFKVLRLQHCVSFSWALFFLLGFCWTLEIFSWDGPFWANSQSHRFWLCSTRRPNSTSDEIKIHSILRWLMITGSFINRKQQLRMRKKGVERSQATKVLECKSSLISSFLFFWSKFSILVLNCFIYGWNAAVSSRSNSRNTAHKINALQQSSTFSSPHSTQQSFALTPNAALLTNFRETSQALPGDKEGRMCVFFLFNLHSTKNSSTRYEEPKNEFISPSRQQCRQQHSRREKISRARKSFSPTSK